MPKKGDTKRCGGSCSSYLHSGSLCFVCNRCGNVYPFNPYGPCGNGLVYFDESGSITEEKDYEGPGWYVGLKEGGWKLIEMK